MRVPLSWLKDFVDITMPVDELAELLRADGLREVRIKDFQEIPESFSLRLFAEELKLGERVAIEVRVVVERDRV